MTAFIVICVAIAAVVGFIYLKNRPMHPTNQMIARAQERMDKKLPEIPSKLQLMTVAEAHWGGEHIDLGPEGSITACAGPTTFVWRDSDGKPNIICGKCLKKKIDAHKARSKGQNEIWLHGKTYGIAQGMHLRANYTPVIGRRGGFRHIETGMPDYHACGC